VNNHAHILEPLDGEHEFWAARIEAVDVSPWVSGSAQPKLTIDAAMSIPVSAPVRVSVRREIADEVTRIRHAERSQVADLARSVDLLSEYKSSLITAAVTGEIDVIAAESRIPE
jgi:type I restriction enzyme S subunit